LFRCPRNQADVERHFVHNSQVSKRALGTLLVSVSAGAFGTYALFALMAGRAGIGPVPLLFYRFGIAAVILGVIAIATKTPLPDGRTSLKLAGLGALYVGQSFTYLQCLRASNPITASLLLYLYPALVTVGAVLFLHEKLTRTKLIALLCALVGSVFIVGPVGDLGGVAVLYGIGTAAFYATYLLVGKRVIPDIPPVSSTLVILCTATLAYGVGSLFTGFDVAREPSGWIGVAGLAVVATVIAIGGLLAGLEKISPVEASSLSALEPLVSAIIAVAFLGQEPRLGQLVGGALVIVAVVVLARQHS
jgi:drug/metabolite transporter (DMT)-like permease